MEIVMNKNNSDLKQLINVAVNKRKRIQKKGISNIDEYLDFFQDSLDMFAIDLESDPFKYMDIMLKIFGDIKK